ncbi:AraC family transcriptional regulator [Pedobacter hiemivivus]|uniref:AraC family transcriptional regulator n=1 Tax=Pedobacter hiemivivus TaxID=2530454 RepID=A0A4V2MK60_9SPHI|nr:AraC family transcriptional regulator [Pedobacter hiemivivus]TCC96986.1 AraC family transcriptional regulator [Pedobacter hiemivivus]
MKTQIDKTRLEYIKRINDVLDYVEKNLDSALSLEHISERGNYSSFHFHRIFSAVIGETLNTFINRKRIEKIASILLVGTTENLNQLAYRYGFNSDNSFSRAFKKYYGISPTDFKSKGKDILSKIGIEVLTLDKYICSIDNVKKWTDMNAQIEVKKLQRIKLAGIMHIGEFDKISETYKKLFGWASQNGLLSSPNFKAVTLYHDNPNVTPNSKVRLSTCITINEDIKAEAEVRQILIQEGNYALGHFEITADAFSNAWESMCVWVVENGFSFRDGDYFEVYHNDHTTHPEHKFIVDICIPVNNGNENEPDKKHLGKLSHYKEQVSQGEIQVDYNWLMGYIKTLKNHFTKEYYSIYKVGNIYQGNMDYSYFPLTTHNLQKQKLKFVIIFNHKLMRFEICLSGQNKTIRKKYWDFFKESDWDKYHLVESIGDSLSIIDHILVNKPNFDNTETLTGEIETEVLKFINNIRDVLE